MPRLPFTALAGTLLLHACSQASPDSSADSSLTSTPAPPTKRTTGTQADSLNGIAGHTFGEPLRNFPGLVLLSKEDELGVRVYQMPAGRERGWFGKHAEYSIFFYQFQDGRFAMFEAVTTGIRMRKEVLSLFGPGKDRHNLMGELDWEGERVRVMYSEKLEPPVTCWLQVYSKPLRRVQQAKQRAQFQVDSAMSELCPVFF